MKTPASLEPLEQRIAPAAVIAANGLSATFNDVDGDLVTVTVSKGHLDPSDFVTAASGLGEILQHLKLSDDGSEFEKAHLSIFAAPQNGLGNGFVNVGWIDATGHKIGKVIVDGDLAKITAGDGMHTAMEKLRVHSLGVLGTTTGAPDYTSSLNGSVTKIRIDGDVKDATLNIAHDIGDLDIGGSVYGGDNVFGGSIVISGDAGNVTVGGSIIGGTNLYAGTVTVIGQLKTGSIHGSIVGGTGAASGGFFGVRADSLRVFGDVLGGHGIQSGTLQAGHGKIRIDGNITGGEGGSSGRLNVIAKNAAASADVLIHGGLEGGKGDESGTVKWLGKHGSLRIAGGMHGGEGDLSGSIFESTVGMETNGINRLVVKGDVVGGAGKHSGSIHAETIGRTNITGDVIGGAGDGSGALQIVKQARTIKIGGDLRGGSGLTSGSVDFQGQLVSLEVGGSIIGGSGKASGLIEGSIADSVSVRGSLIGGSASNTGGISLVNGSNSLVIGGSIIGGDLPATGLSHVIRTGFVEGAYYGKIRVVGSIVSGIHDNGVFALTQSGAISTSFGVGKLRVDGSLSGNATERVEITLGAVASDPSPRTIYIGGSVVHSDILAGYGRDVNGGIVTTTQPVRIDEITVGRDWFASLLSCGMKPGADNLLGTADDELIPDNDVGSISRISKIVINGQVLGNGKNVPGDYGFSAEKIGTMSIGGVPIPLKAGPDTRLIGPTLDVSLHDLL